MQLILMLIISFILGGCGKQTPGPQGAPGSAVAPANCSVTATQNGATITCPDGTSQTIFNGQQGVAGTPGAFSTPVQLCEGHTPTYPNSFPEVALCVNNNLYTVYWNGTQAFLAEIPPGVYASTSPQGCTLTVLPGCQVSQ